MSYSTFHTKYDGLIEMLHVLIFSTTHEVILHFEKQYDIVYLHRTEAGIVINLSFKYFNKVLMKCTPSQSQ